MIVTNRTGFVESKSLILGDKIGFRDDTLQIQNTSESPFAEPFSGFSAKLVQDYQIPHVCGRLNLGIMTNIQCFHIVRYLH